MQYTPKAKFFSWCQVFRGLSLNTLFLCRLKIKLSGFWCQNPMLAKQIDKPWGTFLTESAPNGLFLRNNPHLPFV